MYYLKSRYYDPEVCRFINADAFVSTGQGIIGYNMFAYCNNNPVNFGDSNGLKMDCCVMVNDWGPLASIDIDEDDDTDDLDCPPEINNPIPSLFRLSWGFLLAIVESGQLGSYSELTKVTRGTLFQVHHLIERRFYSLFSDVYLNHRHMPSVVVTPLEHQIYTNAWRERVPYGTDYSMLQAESINRIAIEIYGDSHPEWIEELFH